MEAQQLRKLLGQDESATLEFKSEPYRIDHKDDKTKARQRDELIKDILALANGNSIIAGDTAYLIIGADDKKVDGGIRPIHDIGENILTARRILDIVNPACTPKLEDLDSEIVELDNKRLNVITINPNPHLFETTRRLEPSTTKGAFSEYVVFVRHNESIHVASGKERDAIAKLKRVRFNEARNPPPEPFGAIVGGTIGALTLRAAAEKIIGKKEGARAAGTIAGILFGGSTGFMMGYTYRNIYENRITWNRSTPKQQFFAFLISSIIMSASLFILRFFKRTRNQRAR